MSEQLKFAAYDAVSLDMMAEQLYDISRWRWNEMRQPLPRSYRSIWRMLHVDGFENKRIIWKAFEGLGE
jgi:hypothetical protein